MANAESFNRKFLPRTHILQVVLRWLGDRSGILGAFGLRSSLSILLVSLLTLASLSALPSASYADAVHNTPLAEVAIPSSESASLSESVTSSEAIAIASDQKEHFAQAYVEVLKLLSDREPELAAATSADATSIQDSIEADAVAIIEKNGLTMPEYMQILGLASQDEALRNEVLGGIEAALQK